VTGLALAAGAVSLGLVLIGACDLRPHDIYVAPPPLSTNLPTADGTRAPTVTTQDVYIPPSPSWRVAVSTSPHPTALPSFPTGLPSYSYNPSDPYATPYYATTPYSEPTFDPTPSDAPDPFYDTTAPPAEAPYPYHHGGH
jgi:hypothetical protein